MPVEALFQISEPGESATKAACKQRAAGIDLGTTNSLVAVVQAGQPMCLPSDASEEDAGGFLLPSAVHYASDGSVVVGRRAREELAVLYPRDTILSVKRFMGRGPADAEAARKLTPYTFAPFTPADGVVRFSVGQANRSVTPMEVSAEILKILKARAERVLGGPLEGVVITVPAYFDDGQRQATRDAGRLAGLDVMRLLNEPTAAALAYGLDRKVQGTFAVFDLGGGTFDVSVLALENGVFEVKSTGGDSSLGGDDFDQAIAFHFLHEMGIDADANGDARLIRRVLQAARRAKEALTEADEVSVELAPTDVGGAEVRNTWRSTLNRRTMEKLVSPVLKRCTAPVRRALRDANVKAGKLDGVVLVGGATRMPLVRQFVARLFEQDPLCDLDPDQVVALGAAVQAELLAGGDNPQDVVLLDVVPLSLGLEILGGVAEKLIHRNTTIPCSATQTFTTYADNQTGFELHVIQGERELVKECRSLAHFKLTGIPPAPAGMARLEVTFAVDADGILGVTARERMTGKETGIQVKPSYGLSEEEVERMLLDSFAHAEDDLKERALVEQRVEAERILASTKAALIATPELLVEGEREAIEFAMADLANQTGASEANAIRLKVEGLDRASKDFAARRMNRALEEGVAGRRLDVIEKKVDERRVKKGNADAGADR